MASEITVTAGMAVVNGNLRDSMGSANYSYDQSGNQAFTNTQTATTTATALEVPASFGTLGYCFFRNLDAAYSIEIGIYSGSFQSVVNLGPGQVAMFPAKTNALYVKSSASTPHLYVKGFAA